MRRRGIRWARRPGWTTSSTLGMQACPAIVLCVLVPVAVWWMLNICSDESCLAGCCRDAALRVWAVIAAAAAGLSTTSAGRCKQALSGARCAALSCCVDLPLLHRHTISITAHQHVERHTVRRLTHTELTAHPSFLQPSAVLPTWPS